MAGRDLVAENSRILAERRRREIVEAAYALFTEQGYAATGVADIAARLDIGHGTFYRYFANKRELLDHVVDHGIGKLLDPVLEEMPEAAASFEEFRALMLEFGLKLFAILDEPGLVRVVGFEATAIDTEMTLRIAGLIDTVFAIVALSIQQGVDQGYVRSDVDPAITAKLLGGMLMPPVMDSMRAPVPVEVRERYVLAAIDLITQGIAAR